MSNNIILQNLDKYFKNTPKEDIKNVWDSLKEYDSIGVTFDDYLKIIKNINK